MLLALIVATVLASIASSGPPANARGDFPPFVMTIEDWREVRIAYADGRTLGGTSVARLQYESRRNWTMTKVSDEVPNTGPPVPDVFACRGGRYGHVDQNGDFVAGGRSASEAVCPAPDRWIRYGIAENYHWAKELADGFVTYTDPGERVVFELRTGLPIVYEAGQSSGVVKHRRTYRVEWIASRR